MLSEAQIKSVALFFFYSCMDEETAFASTTKTLEKCKRLVTRDAHSDDEMASVIVGLTYQAWKQWQNSGARLQLAIIPESGWQLAEDADFGVWQDFRRSADPDELLAVIWSKLLKFSDLQIATGIDVTVGTVRHRVGRGLRQLGHIKKSVIKN